MKVSVVLATYNGCAYILPLLKSLVSQSEKIDEVIISDDCSTDDTFDIVKKFIDACHLHNWIAYRNKTNIGFKKNFLNAMKMATGDLIFPCDQDDVWHHEKIRIFKETMESWDKINVLFCRSISFTGDCSFVFPEVNSDLDESKLREVKFAEEVRECYGAGHLICLRRKFMLNYIDSVIRYDLTFDIPFCLLAAKYCSLYELNSTLVARRFHSNNTSGATKYKYDAIRSRYRIIEGRKTRLGYFQFVVATAENKDIDKEFMEFIDIFRNALFGIENRCFKSIVTELFTHNRYVNKILTLVAVFSFFHK